MHLSTIVLALAWSHVASISKVAPSSSADIERAKMTPPLSEQEINVLAGDPDVTHYVTFSIAQAEEDGERDLGELKLAVFGSVAPKTVDNFVQLALGTKGFGYKDCEFHRIIEDFMVQGGNHAKGGKSIHKGGRFDDEEFVLNHNKKGRLSMANAGPNTNGGQFFIVTNPDGTPHLNGHHVVFGQLIDGFSTLDALNVVKTTNDVPDKRVYIKDTKVIRTGSPTRPAAGLTDKLSEQEIFGTMPAATEQKVSNDPPVHVMEESTETSSPAKTELVQSFYGWQSLFGGAVLLSAVYVFIRRGGLRRFR